MLSKLRTSAALLAGALLLTGCAEGSSFGDGLLLTTAATPEAAAQSKVDPACVQLAARIDALRKEGVAERVEQAAAGKGQTVNVKRASLAKVAELNKANADFQSRCSNLGPRPATTAAAAPAPAAPAAVAASAQAKSDATAAAGQAKAAAKSASAVAKSGAGAAAAQ